MPDLSEIARAIAEEPLYNIERMKGGNFRISIIVEGEKLEAVLGGNISNAKKVVTIGGVTYGVGQTYETLCKMARIAGINLPEPVNNNILSFRHNEYVFK